MPRFILPKLGLRRKGAADRSKIGARHSRGRSCRSRARVSRGRASAPVFSTFPIPAGCENRRISQNSFPTRRRALLPLARSDN